MEQTEKYKLNKPGDNDYGDVSVLNENMDKIEAALVAGETGAGALQEGIEGHMGDMENPHGATAGQVGARPDTWMPTADDVGAVPTVRKVNGKALDRDISLSASDVKARPDTWTPTVADVGAAAATHTHTAQQITSLTGTDYSTSRVRGISAGTGDLTAGSSTLASGTIYLVYE